MSNKTIAKTIFYDALKASLPKEFMGKFCQLDGNIFTVDNDQYNLDEYKNIYIFGSGKAAYTMSFEIENILKEKIFKGLIVTSQVQKQLQYIKVLEGSHPLPSQKSFDAAIELLEMIEECSEDDLFIYLLSGGTSALIESPVDLISLDDFQKATQMMLHNGLDIQKINTVRKHISKIKGGRLVQNTKATGVVLVLSDITGNDLYSIGSAPTYADKTTYKDAINLLEENGILELMPKSVQNVLYDGVSGLIEETPKEVKKSIKHYIVASNTHALLAAKKSAESHGLSTHIDEEAMQGSVETMVNRIVSQLSSTDKQCLLFGGECTVKVSGKGSGGRNQHLVALMLREICKRNLNISFLSAGTDGIDGNSDAAGAVADLKSCKDEEFQILEDYIKNFDTYNFFKEKDELIITGPSGTNVIDLAIVIKGE